MEKGSSGKEGAFMLATFEINGHQFMFSDSPPIHNWDFTPAVSIFVACENEAELDALSSKLSEKETVTMPPNNYGFTKKFGWDIDCFGVSWQVNLD